MLALIALGFVTLTSATLALFIYYKNPKSATNQLYSFFAASLVFWSIVMYFSIHPPSPSQMLFFIRLSMLAAILMSYAALLISYTIPSSNFTMNRTRFLIITVLSIFGAITAMSPYMFTGLSIINGNVEATAGPGMLMFIITGLGYTLASLIILARKYRRSTGIVKKQLYLVFIGMFIMFTLLITANFIVVIVFKSSAFINFGPLFTIPFLLLTAYAIVKHQFLDISLLLFRTVTFTLVTLAIISIYAIALFSFLNYLPKEYHTALTIFLALVLVYSYHPLKSVIESLTRNIFYKQAYSSEDFLEILGEIIRSTLTLETLGHKVLDELCRTLPVSRGAFVITQKEAPAQVIAVNYDPKPEYTDNNIYNLRQAAKNDLLIFDDLEEGPIKMLLRHLHLTIVMPLKVKSTFHGLLLLSDKASGETYSRQDVDVLEILMPQLSVAIQNAKSYEEIKGFTAQLKEEVTVATADLRQANRHLKHLDKLKDEFVFIATHELKNPVTAMRGYLSMLSEGLFGPIPDKMKEPLDQLDSSNQQLVELVNDLLQIARAEAKTLTIETKPVDLSAIVTEVCHTVKPLAEQKSLTLKYDRPKKDTLMVMADDTRCKEIMNNLISNAIKYSAQGTITVSHEFNEDKVITHVQDQGYGIAPANQAKIFTRFFRVEAEAAKGIPGTGLGLFIVKQLIEKMGGKIWFNSVYGKGTIFSFSLPKVPKA